LDRRLFIAAAGSATALGLSGCGGGGGSSAAPAPAPPVGPDWTSLSSLMQGSVLLPGASGYAVAAPVFNAVYDGTLAQALVRCASASDVALALAFAHENSLAVTARSGGHGYTGNSTTTGMVIDVGSMSTIVVGSGTATIGAGAKLVDIYDQLSNQGVCIASGSCPTIGIAGITQGGGIGVLDRAYGLTCDSLVSAQVVLADGSVVTCDADTHADLFWALRGGGGGNFGIVTSMTFNTFPTSDLTSFAADFAWADAAKVLAAWQAWPLTLPDTAWSGLVMATTGTVTGTPVIEVSGVFIGSAADFAPIWTQFVADAGATPTSYSAQTQSFHDTLLASCSGETVSQCHLASETSDGEVSRASFVASSDFFDTALPSAGIQAMVGAMNEQQSVGQILIIMDLMGGAIAQVAPDATAFVHRNALFSAQYYISGPVGVTASQVSFAQSVVSGLRATMSPWSSGEAYQNYLDASLENWQQAYYGSNYARLVQVKAAYDPTQVFKPAQGIAPQ
jgi:FAD/FMN-containing dehydrogenase